MVNEQLMGKAMHGKMSKLRTTQQTFIIAICKGTWLSIKLHLPMQQHRQPELMVRVLPDVDVKPCLC